LRKGHPNLVTYSGGRIQAIEPSALVEDPRLRGQPDARLTPDSRESLKRGDAKYAVLMETTVRRDRRSGSSFGLEPASPILVGRLGGTSEFTEQARFDIAIVDTTSQRWVARARRSHAGNGSETAALAFTIPVLFPLPLFGSVTPATERASCTATGEAIGELFRSGR